jgi:tRNA G18 (ribose-2'-O)-methylase SpoU
VGYFEIGIYQARREDNLGTLWRSAYQLGAAGLFTIGRQYRHQASDTEHAERLIPLRHYLTFEEFLQARPKGAALVGVEIGGQPLAGFTHPAQAIYLLGSENNGLPEKVLSACQYVISIEAVNKASYNVAVAGSLVMYHRVYGSRERNAINDS